MIHSLFILNDNGDVIIEKHYRGLVNRTISDYFWDEVTKAASPSEVPPVIITPKFYLVHIYRNGIYFLTTIQNEVPPLLVIDFLQRAYDTFVEYLGSVNEGRLKENFTTVYQLLDEMMDNGLPFTTEPNILREMIKPPNVIISVIQGVTGQSHVSDILPDGTLTNIPWRKMGVKYTNNEIFFDIIEEIDCIIDGNGLVVSCEVHGEIQANCRLSGMPDLTLSFNNPHIMDDVAFHPCVRYSRWDHDKVISFIPPDGAFKLMNYRVKGQLQMPIYVKPQINFNEAGGRVNVMVGPKNTNNKPVESVVVTIPFPKSIVSSNLTANMGAVQYDELAKICKWNIGKLPKDKTPQLSGTVALPSGGPLPESLPTLMVEFKIVMYTASGIKVDSLTCNERYKPYKGVRSITRAGKFQVRA
jgi:AP-3 complex subunit mu